MSNIPGYIPANSIESAACHGAQSLSDALADEGYPRAADMVRILADTAGAAEEVGFKLVNTEEELEALKEEADDLRGKLAECKTEAMNAKDAHAKAIEELRCRIISLEHGLGD